MSVLEFNEQFRLLLAARLRVGAAVLLLTVVLVVLVQPDALTTVTEYVPDWLTTAVPAKAFWLTRPSPAKVYDVPPVAVRVSDVWAQVSVALGLAVSVGAGLVVTVSEVVLDRTTVLYPTVRVNVWEPLPAAVQLWLKAEVLWVPVVVAVPLVSVKL